MSFSSPVFHVVRVVLAYSLNIFMKWKVQGYLQKHFEQTGNTKSNFIKGVKKNPRF